MLSFLQTIISMIHHMSEFGGTPAAALGGVVTIFVLNIAILALVIYIAAYIRSSLLRRYKRLSRILLFLYNAKSEGMPEPLMDKLLYGLLELRAEDVEAEKEDFNAAMYAQMSSSNGMARTADATVGLLSKVSALEVSKKLISTSDVSKKRAQQENYAGLEGEQFQDNDYEQISKANPSELKVQESQKAAHYFKKPRDNADDNTYEILSVCSNLKKNSGKIHESRP
ncbi:hypothetical protein M3Y97_01066100 [Aphelenchoides bicaudatus]|nr:hypothetical protein M3Y97_01066100 [Aphelenchoides bicaudatus]